MRQGQNNRRMRGRGNNGGGGNNNNRRGPNPLTRSYESNGPDVKVRGTAQHVAEKYLSLARDAHSSGDRVMAENYLQHAEHYNRIIATALAQQQAIREQREEAFEDDFADEMDNRFAPTQIGQQQRDQQSENGDQPFEGEQPQATSEVRADGADAEQPRESRPVQPRPTGEGNGGEEGRDRSSFRNRRRERGPRPPREPRGDDVVAAAGEQPDAGGLMATLSRGSERPIAAALEE